MPKKKFNAEQIVTKLRQIEVFLAQGKTIAIACKEVGTADKSYCRWRNEYGRYGYRRVTALLNNGGIKVGKNRVQRNWRHEGQKVLQKQHGFGLMTDPASG